MISESALLILELAGIAFIFAGLPLLYLLRKKGMDVFQKLNWAVVFLTFDNSLFRLVWFLLSVSMARLIKLLSALTCESAWDRVFSVTHGYFELILLNSCPISTINSPFN
jgi:hypothetical protein